MIESEKNINIIRFSLTSTATNLVYGVFNLYIIFFYTDVVKLPAAVVGTIWLAFSVWNGVNDLLTGYFSDFGLKYVKLRKNYIKILAVPLSLSFLLMWFVPLDIEQSIGLIYFTVSIFVFDLFFSIIALNASALFPKLIKSEEKLGFASATRSLMSLGLGGLGAVIAPLLYSNELIGWRGMAIIFTVITLILLIIAITGIKEEIEEEIPEQVDIGKILNLIIKDRNFKVLLGFSLLVRSIYASITLVLPFFIKYTLEISDGWNSLFMGVILLSIVISTPFWIKYYRRVGVKKLTMTSILFSIVAALPLLISLNVIFVTIVIMFIALMLSGSVIVAPDIFFSEVINKQKESENINIEGVYSGLIGFCYRIAPAFVGFLLGIVLENSGYNPLLSLESQPNIVGVNIGLLFAIVPIVSMIILLAVLRFYKEKST